ncbi:MAG: hypothetical protein EOO27_28660, partial [Comamonadaceae bacterium]
MIAGLLRSTASAMLMALLSVSAHAQDICKTGASPINPVVARAGRSGEGGSGGIGGTGVTARSEGDPTGGIGGTGVVARSNEPTGGIGGTGIVGVITGFASICVGGMEVQFDTETPVSDNGQPASAHELAVGQVVAVRAAGSGNNLRALSIAVLHALVGPIEAIDASAGTLRVLGERVKVLNPSALAALRRGDWVRLSGHRQADGVLSASLIAALPPSARRQAQIAGRVSVLTSDAMQVGGTRVAFNARATAHGVAKGHEVLVVGRWDGKTLIAQRVTLDPTRNHLGPVRDVVLEGYVQDLGGGTLSLGQGSLQLDPRASVVG